MRQEVKRLSTDSFRAKEIRGRKDYLKREGVCILLKRGTGRQVWSKVNSDQSSEAYYIETRCLQTWVVRGIIIHRYMEQVSLF